MNKQNRSQYPLFLKIISVTLVVYPTWVFAFGKTSMESVVNFLLPPLLFLGLIVFFCGLIKICIDIWKKRKKNVAFWLMFTGALLSILMVGLWGILGYFQQPLILETSSGRGGIILMADVTQDPILLGASHNVFVAKVLTQTGRTETVAGIRTQYSVEVISNIKGTLDGTITVEQEGGLKDGMLYSIEDAFPMLEPGSTYILATRYNEPMNAYTVIANKNAGKLLSNDSSLDKKDLKALVDKDLKIKSLEAIYANEVLLDADIAHQNTRNSFQSLPPVAKAAAVARADAARASLDASAHAQ